MISDFDKKAIRNWARENEVRAVYLFGSSLEGTEDAQDIDIGVEGIRPEKFFTVTAQLEWIVSKPIDIVDLDSESPFAPLVRKYGRRIYG